MPDVVVTSIVVFDEGMYRGTGIVINWCRLITRHFTGHAIHYAPMRSGELKSGISGEVQSVGPRQVEGIIESSAPHTMFVLRGTTSPIMTNAHWEDPSGGYEIREINGVRRRVGTRGHWMRVRAGNGYRQFYALEVRGQRANNFLERAWRATARNHRAIRGTVPSFIQHP